MREVAWWRECQAFALLESEREPNRQRLSRLCAPCSNAGRNRTHLFDCSSDPSQMPSRVRYDLKHDALSCPAAVRRCRIRDID